MAEVSGYAQLLRAIGQALETLQVRSFELVPVGEDFVVRGTAAATEVISSQDLLNRHTLRVVWGTVAGAENAESAPSRRAQPEAVTKIDLQYTMRDIERLEYEGQARRQDPHRLPDAASLSQILRSIGAYLNQKCARLLTLVRDGDTVSLEYETSLGSRMKENFSASGLYDLWVRMYVQRADREAQ